MSLVEYTQRDHVVTIAYNRPERANAINGAMRDELNAAWERFRDDRAAWVAILTGNGEVFCGGADLRDGAGSTGTFAGTFWEIPTINSFESGLELYKPTIAAVNGACIGYGFTAALACDFLIASDRASFAYPEVRLGMATIVGALRLPERVRWADAMEILLTGDRIDAMHAKAIGLAWRVVPHHELLAEGNALADRLCAAAPTASRATKEVAQRARTMAWVDAVRFGETMRKVAGATADAAEGHAAIAEGRAPEWPGY